MSNLENLTQKILRDAKESADEILAKAKEENEGIVDSRVMDARQESKRIIDKAIDEAKMSKDRVLSSAELYIRDEKLKAKQSAITRTFSIAKDRLENLNEDDYIKFLSNSLKSLDLKGTETIIVPEKFREKVKTIGLKNKVSDKQTVESGFLVDDGKTVINYTFDSLVDYLRDELETEIAQVIFKE